MSFVHYVPAKATAATADPLAAAGQSLPSGVQHAAWHQSADLNLQHVNAAFRHLAFSPESWAKFCLLHDSSWDSFILRPAPPQAKSKESVTESQQQQRRLQLQAMLPDCDVHKLLAAKPKLLSYKTKTLANHMQHLQQLVGEAEAAVMVKKWPDVLYYKPCTLSDKLDALYDFLPNADVGKVIYTGQLFIDGSHC